MKESNNKNKLEKKVSELNFEQKLDTIEHDIEYLFFKLKVTNIVIVYTVLFLSLAFVLIIIK